MTIAAGEPRTRFSRAPWVRQLLQWRWASLLVVVTLALYTVLTLVTVHPSIPAAPDSREYLAAADRILRGGAWAEPHRTPGYPAFLALIFLVTGGKHLGAVVVAQCALFVIAAVEVYWLAWRITGRPWVACLAATPVALNIYMLDWVYSIRDETLAYALVVTLFLTAERLVRDVRPGNVAMFTVVAACLILERPIYIALPALLLVALAVRGIGLGKARQHALALGLSLALIYGCVLGYAALNKAQNGYFGVSYVGDVNLFGKVIEYHMQGDSVPSALQPLQQQVSDYAAHGGWQPWIFAHDHGFAGDYYAQLSTFAHYIVLHYPAQYVVHSLAEAPAIVTIAPGVDARGTATLAFTLSRILSRVALATYLAMPLVIFWLALLLRKGWRDPAVFMAALLLLAVVASIGMLSVDAYDEFYRLRSPIDWAYLVVFTLVALDVGGLLYQRLTRRSRVRESAHA